MKCVRYLSKIEEFSSFSVRFHERNFCIFCVVKLHGLNIGNAQAELDRNLCAELEKDQQ